MGIIIEGVGGREGREFLANFQKSGGLPLELSPESCSKAILDIIVLPTLSW